MVLESCIGRSNRCVHARRPGPCVLVCLPGPPRQHAAQGCRGHHMGSSPPGCSSSQGHRVLPGQHCEDPRCACCGASLDAGSSSVRLADLCLCAGSPHQSSGHLCRAGLPPSHSQDKGGVSWSAMAAGIRAVFPHRPCLCSHESLAHICCIGLCRTHSAACPPLLAHRAASTQPSA